MAVKITVKINATLVCIALSDLIHDDQQLNVQTDSSKRN